MNRVLLSLVYLFACSAWATADISVSNLFTDHMVVQQGKPVVIWGQAARDELVKVSMAGNSAKATADAVAAQKAAVEAPLRQDMALARCRPR